MESAASFLKTKMRVKTYFPLIIHMWNQVQFAVEYKIE